MSPPTPVKVHGFGRSSAVPYSQSSPGSLVSPILVISLSPTWGLDVFTTPKPQLYISSREQTPPKMFTLNVGNTKPGASQHVVLMQPGSPWHPSIPGHGVSGFPHVMQAGWLQVGAG